MKITDLATYLVPPRWLFLKVQTDAGIVGWGEPVIEGRAATVAAAVEELGDYLIGQDPLRIEDHWQVLTRAGFYRGGPVLSSAVAGIDQALWDIAGKHFGVPIHQLLGGPVRDRVRTYSWIGGDKPAEVAEQAAQRRDQGFSIVKMNATGLLEPLHSPTELDRVLDRVASAQQALGPEGRVAVDFHGRLSPATARQLCQLLEPLRPLFVEEPTVPELSGELGRLCDSTIMPIATGERLYSRWDFKNVLEAGIAVAQPDPSHAGGISECRRIAAMAEAHGVMMAPHCPLGPIALAACLQLDFATPNTLIQECSLGIHYNVDSDLLDYLVDTTTLAVTEGMVSRPTRPGLGIEVDEEAVRRAARSGHRWRSPVWRHADESLAEW